MALPFLLGPHGEGLIHLGGAAVGVAIFDDRLEVTSSGPLHFGLSVQDLFHPHESLPWNPLVASAFYRRGIIESWRRGTLKMAELTQEAGLPRPEIEDPGGHVLVRFRPTRYLPPQRIGHDLTDQQQQILALLGMSKRLALRDLVARFGGRVTPRALREDLAFLKRLGLIDSAGRAKSARWFLHGQPDNS